MASNLVDVIVADHRQVDRAFADLEDGGGSSRQRRELADHVIAELVRHSVAEEQYLYPAVRDILPDGDEVADKAIEEHAATACADAGGLGAEEYAECARECRQVLDELAMVHRHTVSAGP